MFSLGVFPAERSSWSLPFSGGNRKSIASDILEICLATIAGVGVLFAAALATEAPIVVFTVAVILVGIACLMARETHTVVHRSWSPLRWRAWPEWHSPVWSHWESDYWPSYPSYSPVPRVYHAVDDWWHNQGRHPGLPNQA